jgi:hypothetical protein
MTFLFLSIKTTSLLISTALLMLLLSNEFVFVLIKKKDLNNLKLNVKREQANENKAWRERRPGLGTLPRPMAGPSAGRWPDLRMRRKEPYPHTPPFCRFQSLKPYPHTPQFFRFQSPKPYPYTPPFSKTFGLPIPPSEKNETQRAFFSSGAPTHKASSLEK